MAGCHYLKWTSQTFVSLKLHLNVEIWRGLIKRFFLLEADGKWSDRRQLMGFISWPLMHESGKVYWNQGGNCTQLLFIDLKLRQTN